jgi:Domain of unknown function (DUF4190)
MGSPDQPREPGQAGPQDAAGSRDQQEPGPDGHGQDAGGFSQDAGGLGHAPGGYGQEPGGYGQAPGEYGYPPPSDYHPGYQNPSNRNNGLAISALVLAILQFLLWFFLLIPGFIAALVALILGVTALGQIRRTGEGGRGMAVTGIVLGALGVLGGIVWIIVFAVQSTNFHLHNPY